MSFHDACREASGNGSQKQKKGLLTAIIATVVRYHEYNLPLENVIVNKTTAYAGNIFVGLHLLELAGEQPRSR